LCPDDIDIGDISLDRDCVTVIKRRGRERVIPLSAYLGRDSTATPDIWALCQGVRATTVRQEWFEGMGGGVDGGVAGRELEYQIPRTGQKVKKKKERENDTAVM